MKLAKIVGIIAGSIILLLLFAEIFFFMQHYHGENLFDQKLKTCSWLDSVPTKWECKDNWNNSLRVITTGGDYHTLTLKIMKRAAFQTLKKPCLPILPLSIPIRTSPSGITVPLWCVGGKGIYQIATWDQDGWYFYFEGFNVQRNFFLNNLATLGNEKKEDVPPFHDTTNSIINPETKNK